jgi:hypothetical protein
MPWDGTTAFDDCRAVMGDGAVSGAWKDFFLRRPIATLPEARLSTTITSQAVLSTPSPHYREMLARDSGCFFDQEGGHDDKLFNNHMSRCAVRVTYGF